MIPVTPQPSLVMSLKDNEEFRKARKREGKKIKTVVFKVMHKGPIIWLGLKMSAGNENIEGTVLNLDGCPSFVLG